MARLPLLDADAVADPSVKAVFSGMSELGLEKFMNQIAVLAHHPPLVKAVFGLLRAYHEGSVVPRKYLEMAILVVSNRNRCHYCVVHHTPSALDAGLSPAQVDAINEEAWAESGEFDETERTVLEFARQVSERGGRVSESTYTAMRAVFSEEQMVELTVRTAMCEFFNRFNEVFQLDVEPVAELLYQKATG